VGEKVPHDLGPEESFDGGADLVYLGERRVLRMCGDWLVMDGDLQADAVRTTRRAQ